MIDVVNGIIIPFGLTVIMFSLGLTLRINDFAFIAKNKRLVAAGVSAHMLLLPLLGLAVGRVFGLEHEMALAVFIIAICPTGTTSNALTYIGGGNVALAVTLTAVSSLATVFTIPLLLSWGIPHFMGSGGSLPHLSMLDTIGKLIRLTVLPIVIGMCVRSRWPDFSTALAARLKPASFIVLIAMLGFSVVISLDMVLRNVAAIAPAMFTLNILALGSGLLIGRLIKADARNQLTLAIEVGVQNAALALFLTASVLGSIELSVSQNIYGVLMLINASILIRLSRKRCIGESHEAQAVPLG